MNSTVGLIVLAIVVLWFLINFIYSLLAWNTAKERGRTDAKSFFLYGILAGPFAWKASQNIETSPLMLQAPKEIPALGAPEDVEDAEVSVTELEPIESEPIEDPFLVEKESFEEPKDKEEVLDKVEDYTLPERPPAPKVVEDIDAIVAHQAKVVEAMMAGEEVPQVDFSKFSSVDLPVEKQEVAEAEDDIHFIEADAVEEENGKKSKSSLKLAFPKKPDKKLVKTGKEKEENQPKPLPISEAVPPEEPTMGVCTYCKQSSYAEWHGLCANCAEVWVPTKK